MFFIFCFLFNLISLSPFSYLDCLYQTVEVSSPRECFTIEDLVVKEPFCYPSALELRGRDAPEWLYDFIVLSYFLEKYQKIYSVSSMKRRKLFKVELELNEATLYEELSQKFEAYGFSVSVSFIQERLEHLKSQGLFSFDFCEKKNRDDYDVVKFCFASSLQMTVYALWISDHTFFVRYFEQIGSLSSVWDQKQMLSLLLREIVTCLSQISHLKYEKMYTIYRSFSFFDCAQHSQLLKVLCDLLCEYLTFQYRVEDEVDCVFGECFQSTVFQMLFYLQRLGLFEEGLLEKEKWVSTLFPSLRGGIIVDVTPELYPLCGGLGRVERYHLSAMSHLGLDVVVLQPFYKYDKQGKNINLESQIQYVGMLNICIDPTNELSQQEVVSVYRFCPKFHDEDLPYELFFLKFDSEAQLYGQEDDYSKLYFSLRFALSVNAFLKSKDLFLEQESSFISIINCNDAQSSLVPPILEYEKTMSPDFIQGACIVMTTHTYSNRGFVCDDALIRSVIPERFYHFGYGFQFQSGNITWSMTTLGAHFSQKLKGVSNIHALENQGHTPLRSLVGVPNGCDLEESTFILRGRMPTPYKRYSYFRLALLSDLELKPLILMAKLKAKEKFFKGIEKRFGDSYHTSIDFQLPIVSYSGRMVREKACSRALTRENILFLLERGVHIVIFGSVQNEGESRYLFNQFINIREEVRCKGYAGRLILVDRFTLEEQYFLLAATTVQVQDSDRATGAAEYTESNAGSNGAIQLSPPYHEGLITSHGVPIHFENQQGNVLVPASVSSQDYLSVLIRFFSLDEDLQLSYQLNAFRNNRILDAHMTALNYIDFFNGSFGRSRFCSSLFASLPQPWCAPQVISYEVFCLRSCKAEEVDCGSLRNNGLFTQKNKIREKCETQISFNLKEYPIFFIDCRVCLNTWPQEAFGIIVSLGGFQPLFARCLQKSDEVFSDGAVLLTYEVRLPRSFLFSVIYEVRSLSIQFSYLSHTIGAPISLDFVVKDHQKVRFSSLPDELCSEFLSDSTLKPFPKSSVEFSTDSSSFYFDFLGNIGDDIQTRDDFYFHETSSSRHQFPVGSQASSLAYFDLKDQLYTESELYECFFDNSLNSVELRGSWRGGAVAHVGVLVSA